MSKDLITDNDLLKVIREAAMERFPNEACGLVVQTNERKFVAVETENSSEDPTAQFLISAEEYARCADMGEIIGVWHTHTNGNDQPSQADYAGCENSNLPWYLLSIKQLEDESFVWSDLIYFEPEGREIPYLERPYAFGAMDCWSLVRDYHKREFGIQLGDYPRYHEFWKNQDTNFFENCWQDEDLIDVTGTSPQVGDIFFMQTDNSGNPNHVAVYVGDDRILHHCHGRLSRRDIYGGYWAKHTVRHVRHISKC